MWLDGYAEVKELVGLVGWVCRGEGVGRCGWMGLQR